MYYVGVLGGRATHNCERKETGTGEGGETIHPTRLQRGVGDLPIDSIKEVYILPFRTPANPSTHPRQFMTMDHRQLPLV